LAQEYEGRVELIKVEADLPGNEELLEKYGVSSLPTVVLQIGKEVWGTVVGIRPEQELRDWLDFHLRVAEDIKEAGADAGTP
jgi:thioredoxin-like negative regulator of GroEL